MNSLSRSIAVAPPDKLSFLWLELTNLCNLECSHCYAESSPRSKDQHALSLDDYVRLFEDARNRGCDAVQFIGGEPTLNRALPELIDLAKSYEFEKIEVFTNLVSLPGGLLDKFSESCVSVATSVYSWNEENHDSITRRRGSWQRTVANIKAILAKRITLRAAIVVQELNRSDIKETELWLRSLGVNSIGFDEQRPFGRAGGREPHVVDLCGQCANGTICISPEGIVTPCIMSKAWPVGNIRTGSLADILDSTILADVRKSIALAHADPAAIGGCQPDNRNPCGPDRQNCNPCNPMGHCGPNKCQPHP